jgi:hypothetical protein
LPGIPGEKLSSSALENEKQHFLKTYENQTWKKDKSSQKILSTNQKDNYNQKIQKEVMFLALSLCNGGSSETSY